MMYRALMSLAAVHLWGRLEKGGGPLKNPWAVSAVGIILGMLWVNIAISGAENGSSWQDVKAPDVWKNPPKGQNGYSWYRCFVAIPDSWKGRDLELFVEPVDDAREYFWNGAKIGGAGSFPPDFRSGLGDQDRHSIDAKHVLFGATNVFSIRVHDTHGRGGFNVAAPVVFGGDEAIRFAGVWEYRSGDNPEWAKLESRVIPSEKLFRETLAAADVNRSLRQLPGEEGPLSPADALKRMQAAPGLAVDLVLSDPDIGQPLSMKFDARGRLWVAEYLQYPTPAGLKVISRDKFLRAVYDKVPLPPPHHARGRDRISIHEDTDGDGRFDRHGLFVDGLNLMTSFEYGAGGVWVLNPPFLLFYPDRNADDVPDGDPEVHLQGFGLEDSHSIANNLRWGPDGWLYAAQGSTVSADIIRPGLDKQPIHSMGQLIWRYHPASRTYEVFGEGGGNTFGVEMDAKGRVYSGHNGGDTRGFHYVQGGYYQKGFGKHGALSNPFAFGYFPAMVHHAVPRFTHTFIIYEGAALPPEYEGKLFGVGPLQSHVIYSDIQPNGSTFKTKDVGLALSTKDTWFRPVDIQAGPDGGIYVADFYEQRIDHASHYQGRVDKETGRIYRLRAADRSPGRVPDLSRLSSDQLIERLADPNKWTRQTVQRLIAERRDRSSMPKLLALLDREHGQLALETLWAIQRSGGLTEDVALKSLAHQDPYVRLWTVRLLGDARTVSPSAAARFRELAAQEAYVEVRSQLASTARRLPAEQAMPIVRELLNHAEDIQDPHVPLLIWWAIETHADAGRDAVIAMSENPAFWSLPMVQTHVLERLMRRYAQAGTRKDLLVSAKLLELAPNEQAVGTLMKGFEQAFEGRTLTGLPDELTAIMTKRGGGSLALRLRQGTPDAIAEAMRRIEDGKVPSAERIQLLQVVGQIRPPSAVSLLLKLAESSSDVSLRNAAISSLQGYDEPRVGTEILRIVGQLQGDSRDLALTLLASRAGWTRTFLDAVGEGKIPADSVPLPIVRRVLFHRDQAIADAVKKYWGEVGAVTTDEMRADLAKFTNVLTTSTGNPYRGKGIFKATCGKCHTLFDEGGKIGPDLTAYKRDDLNNMLLNVVNPSIQIREGFENHVVFTDDGRTLNGFVADQDNRVLILRTAEGQSIVVPKDEIEDQQVSPQSIMPEGLLKPLAEQEIRDLFAYLRMTQPLPE